jgi:hypothetical protein
LNFHRAASAATTGGFLQTALSNARRAARSRELSSGKRASDKALTLIRR